MLINYIFEGEKEKGLEESDPKPSGKQNAPKKPGNVLIFAYEELLKNPLIKSYWD